MTTQFELRLIGADAPAGQLDADDLVAIIRSLQEIATRLGRVETDAAKRGRPSRQVERVARLQVGLAPGSTRILVERRGEQHSLGFDLSDEQAVDAAFQQIIESVAVNARPAWVTDSVAASAAELTSALKKAAPEVEFSAAGTVRARFKTSETDREVWRNANVAALDDPVTYVGRLEKVDIKRHDFRIRDDVGNEYSLPRVANDVTVMHLIGIHVMVTGNAERDALGRVSAIRDARIAPSSDPASEARLPSEISLEQIMASAPGPSSDGIPGLTEDEADAFFDSLAV